MTQQSDEVTAFRNHCIHVASLVRSGELGQVDLHFIEGCLAVVKAETEVQLRGGLAQVIHPTYPSTREDVQLEAHLDGLPCGYNDCRICLGRCDPDPDPCCPGRRITGTCEGP